MKAQVSASVYPGTAWPPLVGGILPDGQEESALGPSSRLRFPA